MMGWEKQWGCLGVSYVNDGMVGSRDPDWLHHSMNVMIGLFGQYGVAAA